MPSITTADAPKTLIPSNLGLRLTQEDTMVRFFLERLKYYRTQMGWASDRSYVMDSWLWKRYVATCMQGNIFSWRIKPGNLFSKVNMSRNMVEQAVTHHWSRICDDLVKDHEFIGVQAEGPEDDDPVVGDVQRFIQTRAKRQKLDKAMRDGLLGTLTRGESVTKAVQVNRRVLIPRTARPIMQDGSALRTTMGQLVTELDAWDPHPVDPAKEVLRKDNRLMKPKGAKLALSDRKISFHETKLERGAEIKWMHYADFVTQLNVCSLDDAEITGHIFEKSVFDLLDELPAEMINPQAKKAYLQERRDKAAEMGADHTQSHREAGELEDYTYDPANQAYKTARYAEIYGRYSPFKDGRWERIYLLVDMDLNWPIAYGFVGEFLTWTDRPHPFGVERIHPSTEGRWYGEGYFMRHLEMSNFVDKCDCRIELELARSGNLLFENPEATDEGRMGLPLTFRSPQVRRLRGDFTADEAVSVKTVQPQVNEISTMGTLAAQTLQSYFGITSANDPALQNMPAADTLGGMEMLQDTSNVNVRKRESEVLEGMNDALVRWSEAELKNVDPKEVIDLLGEERAAGVLEWIELNRNQLSDHLIIKSEAARKARLMQENDQVMAILTAWINIPPMFREAYRSEFENRLKLLGVKDPKRLLVNPELEMQAQGASPAQAKAAVNGEPPPAEQSPNPNSPA